MTGRPPVDRSRLIELPSGTELLRELRYVNAEQLGDISDDELEHAVRWLHAAAYSAKAGAVRLQQIINERKATPCTSAPSTTAPSTSTAEPSPADPSSVPKSPSKPRTRAPESS